MIKATMDKEFKSKHIRNKESGEALKDGFSLRGFHGNLCLLCCVNAIVYIYVLLKSLYVLLHLIRFKTYSWYQRDI